jgi:hypothetical protein
VKAPDGDEPLRSAARMSGMVFGHPQALASLTSLVSDGGNVGLSGLRPPGRAQALALPRDGAGLPMSDANPRGQSTRSAPQDARANTGHGAVSEPIGVTA